jgi:hypothetical protein
MDKGGIYPHKARVNFLFFTLAYFKKRCYISAQEMLHRAFLPGRLGRFDRADPLARWVYSQPYCKSFRTGGLFGRPLGVCWNGSPDGIFSVGMSVHVCSLRFRGGVKAAPKFF